jgi:hypothetical protein
MNCESCQPLISIYVDEPLDDVLTREMLEHLPGCEECRTFLRSTLDIHNLVGASPKALMPGRRVGLPLSTTRREERRTPLFARRVFIPISAVAVIIVLLVASLIGCGFLLMHMEPQANPGIPQVVYMTTMPVVEVYAPTARPNAKTQ